MSSAPDDNWCGGGGYYYRYYDNHYFYPAGVSLLTCVLAEWLDGFLLACSYAGWSWANLHGVGLLQPSPP